PRGDLVRGRGEPAVHHQPARGTGRLPQRRGALRLRARPRKRPAGCAVPCLPPHAGSRGRFPGAVGAGAGRARRLRDRRHRARVRGVVPGPDAVHVADEHGGVRPGGPHGADLLRRGRLLPPDPVGERAMDDDGGPLLAGVALTVLFALIVINFDVLIGLAEPGVLSWLLPAIIVVPGIAGVAGAYWLRSARP